MVPYRTLHRFATERRGFGRRDTTVRIVDGQRMPDRLRLPRLSDRSGDRSEPQGARADPHRRVLAAHVRVADVLADPGGGGHRGGRGQSAAVAGLVGLRPAHRIRHRPGPDPVPNRSAPDRKGSSILHGNYWTGTDFANLGESKQRAEARCRDIAREADPRPRPQSPPRRSDMRCPTGTGSPAPVPGMSAPSGSTYRNATAAPGG